MGGLIAATGTIGGTVAAPGLPLLSSPLSGFYQLNNGIGATISSSPYMGLDFVHFAVGPYGVITGNIAAVSGSPFSSGLSRTSVASNPNGLFVYAVNSSLNQISSYSRNMTTGVLTAVGTPVTVASSTGPIAVSKDGAFLYSVNNPSSTFSIYSINNITGQLTETAFSPLIITGLSNPNNLTITPDNAFLYVANQISGTGVSCYSLNHITGNLTFVASYAYTGIEFSTNIKVSNDGLFLYVVTVGNTSSFIYVHAINKTTGVLTLVNKYATGNTNNLSGLDISPDGILLAVSQSSGGGSVLLYSRNTFTGQLTPIGTPYTTADTGLIKCVFSLDGAYLYADGATSGLYVWTVSGSTLTTLSGSPFAVTGGGRGMIVSPDNSTIYVGTLTNGIYAFNVSKITSSIIYGQLDTTGGANNSLLLNATVKIYGSLNINDQIVATAPNTAGNAGKFLRVDTSGSTTLWDGVNTNVPVVMTANVGSFTITDSGNFQVDVSGALTAQGTLTATLSVPADATTVIFDNSTTGGFPLVLNNTWTIPQGKSTWYWNGSTFEITTLAIAGQVGDQVNVSYDASRFREGQQSTLTSGTAYTTNGNLLIMKSWMHNTGIDTSGNLKVADATDFCSAIFYSEEDKLKGFGTSAAVTAGVVPTLINTWYLDNLAGNVWYSGMITGGDLTAPAGITQAGIMLSTNVATGENFILRKSFTGTNSANLALLKSRGTNSSPLVVVSGDSLSFIHGNGFDGTNYVSSVGVLFAVDGAVSTGIVPGRFIIQTANASGVMTEALRIDSAQNILGKSANAILIGQTTPTISSGFGTTPSITANGCLTFRLNVGTGGTASSGVIGFPASATGWNVTCRVFNPTATNLLQTTEQTASTTTSATITNYTTSTGAVTAWPAGTVLIVTAVGY